MAKKAAAETVKAPAGLKTSLRASSELAAVIGPEPLARTEAVRKFGPISRLTICRTRRIDARSSLTTS
jgi:hypothetical protein